MKQTGPTSPYNIIEFPNYFTIQLGSIDRMTFYRSRFDQITVEWIMENLERAYEEDYRLASEEFEALPDR